MIAAVPKPLRGSDAHRDFMVRWIHDAAADLGVPVQFLKRDAFLKWADEREPNAAFRPTRDCIAAYGGALSRNAWSIILGHALAESGEAKEPVRAELGQMREIQRGTNYARKLERLVGDEDYYARRLETALVEAVERCPPVVTKQDKTPAIRAYCGTAEVVAVMSDLHFGVCVDRREVPGGAYSWQIAARRLALFCERIARYGVGRAQTLRLLWMGDTFDGRIHATDAGLDLLVNQIDGTRQILVHAIDYLRQHFDAIRVECGAGNHGRWPWPGQGRPASQKYDGADAVVARGVEHIFRDCNDVAFNTPRTPYNLWTACGFRFLATHGDSLFNIRHPEKGLRPKELATRLYELESSELGGKVDAVVMGHHHYAVCAPIPGRDPGATLVVNGSTLGRTAYAQTAGYTVTPPSQVMWTVTEEEAVADWNQVMLRRADEDSALDAIIPPPVPIGDSLRRAAC
jgi:hypothetical protein